MKPSIRLLKTLSTAARKGSRDGAPGPNADNPHAETLTRWRVMPADLDLFGHMNNSRYLMLMEFARLDRNAGPLVEPSLVLPCCRHSAALAARSARSRPRM
jgi:Acyl-ACP thioesterase